MRDLIRMIHPMSLPALRTRAAQHPEQRDDRLDLGNLDFILLVFLDILQLALAVWTTAQLRLLGLADLFRFWLFPILELTFSMLPPALLWMLDMFPPRKRNRLTLEHAVVLR